MGLFWILVKGYKKVFTREASPGRGFISKILAALYMKYLQISGKKSVVATIDGITYQLDLTESIDLCILTDSYEPESMRIIPKLIKDGMTVMDIGANVGVYALRLAKLVGEKGRVFAFEPTSYVFPRLIRNIELNNFNNIISEKIALSDTYAQNQLACIRSSFKVGDSCSGNPASELISFVTLDDYVRARGIERVDFIKLDVDGYEYKVIRGALEVINKFSPLILLELCPKTLESVGDNIIELVNTLANLRYKFYSVKGLSKFSSADAVIESIPESLWINVFLSVSDLLLTEGGN